MRHSLELLTQLRERHPDKAERALALEMGYSDTAFQQATMRGNMSPQMAVEVAVRLGEDPKTWALVATVESAKDPAVKRRLKALLQQIAYAMQRRFKKRH